MTIEGGNTPYVSYVFGLDVSGMTVAMEPTAPTLLPTETLVPHQYAGAAADQHR